MIDSDSTFSEAANEVLSALNEAINIIIWMSGAEDFGPGGKANEGWVKARERLDHLFLVARKYE